MYALMLWCYWSPDMDSLALGTSTGGGHLWWDLNPPLSIFISENAYRVLFTKTSINTLYMYML